MGLNWGVLEGLLAMGVYLGGGGVMWGPLKWGKFGNYGSDLVFPPLSTCVYFSFLHYTINTF